MEKKSFVEKKGFAAFALCFGIVGLLLMAHHIFSYENILRPFMDYLIENKIITNDISGIAFLRMFTNESNILVDIFLVLYAIGIFGSEKLYKFTHCELLRGAITLNIADQSVARVGDADRFANVNDKSGMFAPYLTPDNVYTLPAFLTQNQPLHYQLHEHSTLINAADTTRATLSTLNSLFTPFLGYYINLQRDLDLLSSPRVLDARLDLGCFETWRVPQNSYMRATNLTNEMNGYNASQTPQSAAEGRLAYLDNYGGNYYPHAGAVVYLMRNADLVIDTDAGNPLFSGEKTLRPSYMLLSEGASLYGQGNTIQLSYVAAEKRFTDQQYSMMSLPFNHDVANIITTKVNAAKAKNVPLSVICEGMGHNSEATTQIYLASLETSVVDKANKMILGLL